MTAVAAKLLDEFKALSPAEQVLVRDQVITLTQATQLEALGRLSGCSVGENLLEKLLSDRAKERECG